MPTTRAQESREAIQRLYIAMRHLFIRGNYKPLGESGRAVLDALRVLSPEIYGSLNDPEQVELGGFYYIFQRLPKGIEQYRYIKLISREGYEQSFTPIVAAKRRRNAYRIDGEQIFIEMTRGRSDIYDILTHLTFMYNEASKIRRNSMDSRGHLKRDWLLLEDIVEKEKKGEDFDKEVALTYLSSILGLTFSEVFEAYQQFEAARPDLNSLFHITYWLGKRSIEEFASDRQSREIAFSSALRQKIGQHIYGEIWSHKIKQILFEKGWLDRPLHIISANLHSVVNSLYAYAALKIETNARVPELEDVVAEISLNRTKLKQHEIIDYAKSYGLYELMDDSGMNIDVQFIDTTKLEFDRFPKEVQAAIQYIKTAQPLLLVMNYAFGEQAYEITDELLKPFEVAEEKIKLKVASISIMGKAGILEGKKGDLMIPNAHVFEGTADNYPFENELEKADFEGYGLKVVEGPMVTVMGTSLQNKDILRYFLRSSWKAIGLEMEGAHYQKAIQAASKIRNNVRPDVVLRYAYYASDNPLVSGATLASGSLGIEGVKPTYLVTVKILNQILNPRKELLIPEVDRTV